MTIEFITFLLAFTGYIGLAMNATLVATDRHSRYYMIPVALIVAVHVLMVWWFRYDWQFAQATRNGYAGFLLFHTALLSIIASPAAGRIWSARMVLFSFLVVTMGATGAVFRYEVVAMYRYPVILVGITGLSIVARYLYLKRSASGAL